jgi:hypothetical protein
VDYFFAFVTPKETDKISKCFFKSFLGASTILGNNNLPTSTFHIKETQFCFVALYLLLRYLFSLMVKFSQNNDLTDFGSRCTGDCSRVQPKRGDGW